MRGWFMKTSEIGGAMLPDQFEAKVADLRSATLERLNNEANQTGSQPTQPEEGDKAVPPVAAFNASL